MNSRLRADPRTSWATHVYQQFGSFPAILDPVADYILNWLGTEHVEILTRGVSGNRRPILSLKAKRTGLVVRTPSRYLLLYDNLTGHQWTPGKPEWIQSQDNYVWGTGKALQATDDDFENNLVRPTADTFVAYRIDRKNVVQVFTPTALIAECLTRGAGRHILRLPERSDVPPMPDLDDLSLEHTENSFEGRILTGWNSVEELAAEHLRFIGVHDARQTQSGADGGLDVASPRVAAQVKQIAKPVGRPMLQGLIGAADHGQYTVFYTTSGYTDEAIDYAHDRDIALYEISGLGAVTPVNDWTQHFERTVGPYATAWRRAYTYKNDATYRSIAAHKSLDPSMKSLNSSDSPYLIKAMNMIIEPPPFDSPRDMAIHYHHAELLIATWATYTHGHYPTDAVLPADTEDPHKRVVRPPSLSDFY